MNENMAWVRTHTEEVRQCAEDNFAESGRGVVDVTLIDEDATFSFFPVADLLLNDVGKFEISLKAMLADCEPASSVTLLIRRDSEVMGCGTIADGRVTGWCWPSDSLLFD